MDPAMAIEVAAMSRQRVLEEATARGDSEIQRFYRGSTVFLTGGSGFMGKQLIEKLFRSCQLAKMFVLLRTKKGKPIQERLETMFQDPVFEALRKQQPDFEQKIVAIEGDTAELKLGISEHDWQTITEEVDVIYHMAATTRFDEVIKVATLINVRGTREAITLGKACKKLKSFVHVSTAYSAATSNRKNQEVYEKFYASPISPNTLISLVETTHEDRLNSIKDNLIRDWPNTYTFTKAVAEELVRTMAEGVPICIVRPGVVVATYREPTPGWMDISCSYGATGILLGAYLGVLHVFLCRRSTKIDFVPCEYVNNAIITAGKAASHSTGGETTKIYAVSSNVRNPVTNEKLIRHLETSGRKLVSSKAIYYLFLRRTSHKSLYLLYTWLLHVIPAHIVDFLCLLLGKERRFVKISRKVYNMTNSLSYFSLNYWQFVDKNLENLYTSLSKTDKIIFNFDITNIDWSEYIQILVIGVRKYIIKDGLKDTECAVKKQFWLRNLHCVISGVYVYSFWKLFSFLYSVLGNRSSKNIFFRYFVLLKKMHC